MKLTIIGCTGSMSGPHSPASCYLIQAPGDDGHGGTKMWNVAFDLGPGSYGKLWNHIDPSALDAVVLSHLHADHCGDLVSLHVYQKWAPFDTGGPMVLAGPCGTRERLAQIDGNTQKTYDHEFDFVEMRTGIPLRIGPLTVTPFDAWHPVPAFSYRVEGPAGFPVEDRGTAVQLGAEAEGEIAVFTFTGDTDYTPSVENAARGAHLLLAEAGFVDGDAPRDDNGIECRGVHMTAVRTGELAANAAVGCLIATHIQPWTSHDMVWEEIRSTWTGPLDIASSGASYLI